MLSPSALLTTVEYKIGDDSITKNRTKKHSCIQKIRSEHCASLEIKKKLKKFSYVSELFGPKNHKNSFDGEGWGSAYPYIGLGPEAYGK